MPALEDVGGHRLHITRWGVPGGARLVLLHGSPQGTSAGGSAHFAHQQPLAARGLELIVPDRPGHGRSPAPGRPDDAQADAAWAVELVGAGGHLVGHSFGACVALAAAARLGRRVKSLVLVEPGMQTLAMDAPAVRQLGLKMLAAKWLVFGDAARARRFSALVGIPDAVRHGTHPAELAAMGRAVRQLKVPSRAALESQLATVRDCGIPLLVVSGGWNAAFEATCARVAERGGGRHVVIPTPHHFPNFQPPFNGVLESFVHAAEAGR